MAKFELQPGEQLLKQNAVRYQRSRRRFVPGPCYLTDRRFVHTDATRSMAVGGLVGALLMKAKVDADIPLAAITGISRGRFGRKQEIITLETGPEGHNFVAPFEEWLAAFREALHAFHATALAEHEPGRWLAYRR
ncbi:MAG TPA: hypothetical protein VFI47_12755 [Acidimicrobiales bacterium]|nr:hypothetical protein [Acidimicrobiales bacterium]